MRWISADKLHITLVFLGSTSSERVEPISRAIADVAARWAPFRVATGHASGRVGGRRGGVAWLRLASGADDIGQLAREVDDALGTGIYDAQTPPRPHLTVARAVTEDALHDLRHAAAKIRLEWVVDRIVLVRSYTERAGSRYEELGSWNLAASANVQNGRA